MSVVTEKLQLLITASAKGVKQEIDSVGQSTDGASKKTGLYQTALSKLGMEGKSTGQVLGTAVAAGAVVGGAALAKFALDGVEKFADLTSQVRGFQRVAGTSAEDSSKLVFSMRELGIAPDTAAASVGRLETKLGTGKANLEKFGIATKDASGKTLDAGTIIANVADAYQNAGSQSEKAAIGNEAFGKSWQKMAPLLGKSRDELEKLYAEAGKDHQIFSQTDLENGRKLALATTQLKDAFTGLQVELGSALAPAIAQGTNALTSTIHTADDATSSVGGLGGIFKATASQFSVGGGAIAAATDLWHHHYVDALGDLAKNTPVLGQVVSLFDDGSDSSNKFGDAQTRLSTATKNVAEAVAQHGAKSKEARDAETELTGATRDLDGIQKGLSSSLQKVNDDLTTHTQKLYEDQQATIAAGSDKLAYENSVGRVQTAFEGLNEQLVANLVNDDGSAQATEAVSQKQRDLATAVLSAGQAAAKQAIDNAGPNASASDKMKAATEAQNTAVNNLFTSFPGLREQVQGYTGDLGQIPPAKHTEVTNTAGQALSDAEALRRALDEIPRYIPITFAVTAEQYGNFSYVPHFSDRNLKYNIVLVA